MKDEGNETALQDESAVQAVRGGDAERYRELVERHQHRVFAVAWSRVGDAALAEEATQEAFIRAYRRLWMLGDGARFAGWVSSIARRLAINFGVRHRRELNKRQLWAIEARETPAPDQPEPDPESAHTPETLRQTLAELPATHRECLVLFYLEGKSGTEAAAILGISESAFRVRLHRARAVMRERLEGKLEVSLGELRPGRTLLPAIMASVLASSSAKAATGGAGAAVVGVLGKMAATKWLIPLGSFISLIGLLPALAMSWLVARLELKNFRDQGGFRARLFHESSRWALAWVAFLMVGIWILIPGLGLSDWKMVYLLLGGIRLVQVPQMIRWLRINRSRFYVSWFVCSNVMFASVFLVGLGLMPLDWCLVLILTASFVMVFYQTQEPRRMDYNLFLRAAEGLLTCDEAGPQRAGSRTRADLFAFARFLGTRWLVTDHRWSSTKLRLKLAPARASAWGMVWAPRGWSRDSELVLEMDGRITVEMNKSDGAVLRRLFPLPSFTELQDSVSRAVALAWVRSGAGDNAGAERALGEVPESRIFIVPRARTLATSLQRGLLVGCLLFVPLSFILLKTYTGAFPAFSAGAISKRNYVRAMNALNAAATEDKRFYALGSAAKESFAAGKIEDARKYAEELLAGTPNYRGNWNYGNAVHDANVVLGRIALNDGNIGLAKEHLLAAGRSPGSPQMNSFGPNMTLAEDLAKKGERETVLEYLSLCRTFWKKDHGKLDQWTNKLKRGRTPDFGANRFF